MNFRGISRRSMIGLIFVLVMVIGVIIYWIWFGIAHMSSNHVANYFSQGISPSSHTGQHFSLIPSDKSIRSGDVWIKQDENGLVIVGGVKDDQSSGSGSVKHDIAAFDHVDLWLADARDVALPPIGWGNQFGSSVLNTGHDCYTDSPLINLPLENPDQCARWFDTQVAFRAQFKKLFVRQWRLAPNISKEIYATAAFNSFPQYIQGDIAVLQPQDHMPTMTVSSDTTGQYSYDFEIDVPWNALPPMRDLSIGSVRVLLDVFGSDSKNDAGPYLSVSGSHAYGDVTAFKNFALPQPRTYVITSCHYPLTASSYGSDADPEFSDGAVPYFIPSNTTVIEQAIMVDNTIAGYQYDPDPSSTSPTVYALDYFEHAVQPGETICGPQLAYVSNGHILSTNFFVASTSLAVQHISNNELLVKNGPYVWYSYYGSGQCGACAHGSFNMYYLNTKIMTSSDAYSFEDMFDSNDADFVISPDWHKIIEYDFGPPVNMSLNDQNYFDSSYYVWTSKNYCFNMQTHRYDTCGSDASATPPSPRNFQPVLQSD